jgi:hypothetical protein
MKVLSASPAIIIVLALFSTARADHHEAPKGFASLFNGKDLGGWHGLDHFDPRKLKSMSDKERAEKRAKDNADLAKHWKVVDDEIVNDGHGVYLTTDKDYGDFEFLVDWKMVEPRGDSGIYLRGSPQVQIWDPSDPSEGAKKNGNPKGSGALWNNNPDSDGRFPLAKADKPIGEWNTLRVKMVGDRVTVHLNDQLTVDNAVMHNYFDRAGPMFETGPIQLQTHGSEMHFRKIFVREIPRAKKSSP